MPYEQHLPVKPTRRSFCLYLVEQAWGAHWFSSRTQVTVDERDLQNGNALASKARGEYSGGKSSRELETPLKNH